MARKEEEEGKEEKEKIGAMVWVASKEVELFQMVVARTSKIREAISITRKEKNYTQRVTGN